MTDYETMIGNPSKTFVGRNVYIFHFHKRLNKFMKIKGKILKANRKTYQVAYKLHEWRVACGVEDGGSGHPQAWDGSFVRALFQPKKLALIGEEPQQPQQPNMNDGERMLLKMLQDKDDELKSAKAHIASLMKMKEDLEESLSQMKKDYDKVVHSLQHANSA